MKANQSETLTVAFGVGNVEISGVDTLHCSLAQGIKTHGFNSFLLAHGNAEESNLTPPESVQRIFVPPPPSWMRLLLPRRSSWTRFCNRRYNRISHEILLGHRPLTLIAGHMSGMWMPKTHGITQLGVIHAADEGNINTLKTYHTLWDACIAVNEDLKELILKAAPELSARTYTILNGVAIPSQLSTRSNDAIRILVAGRVVQKQKRILDLPLLIEKMVMSKNVQISIAGDGEELEELKISLSKIKTEAKCSILGKVSHDDLLQTMDKTDIFLSLSEYEGTPMALMEAMARGCIPVSTNGCGGAYDMLSIAFPDHLFNVGDVAHGASILDRLISSPYSLPLFQQKARDAIRNSEHTLDKMTANYVNVISVINNS